jgi:ubiquinone/menaquinone biosynthesis C-methylase UbiE
VTDNPKTLVEAGYDAMAGRYLAEFGEGIRDDPRARFIAELSKLLTSGAEVLELGCGAGVPATALLAERFSVLGVDISSAQLALARQRVPHARFLKADMTVLELPAESFDAITAFYCFNHIPLDEQQAMVANAASWLRPGGLLLASFGTGGSRNEVEQWLGVPMFFASHGMDINRRHLADAHLTLLIDEHLRQGEGESWQWVLARADAS